MQNRADWRPDRLSRDSGDSNDPDQPAAGALDPHVPVHTPGVHSHVAPAIEQLLHSTQHA